MKPSPLSELVASPAAGFDQPFEMMEACHERVRRTLALLARLRAHVAQHGADAQAQGAARDVLRYFDIAAPEHHRDEELHVFPPLVAHGDPALLTLVARLRQDHLQMECRWRAARGVLAAIERGEPAGLSPRDAAALDAFTCLYDGHMEAEESIAFPAAAKLLPQAAARSIGEEMAHRRNAAADARASDAPASRDASARQR